MIKEYIEDQLEASEILLEAAEQAKCYTEAFRHQVRIRLLKDLISEGVNLNIPDVSHFYSGEDFYVAQKEKYGCALACMAMLLHIGYKEIKSMWKNKEEGVKCGIGEYKYSSFLWSKGFVSHSEHKCEAHTQKIRLPEEWIKPFAPVHIVGVNLPNGGHALIWLPDGRVYDPYKRGVYSIDQYDVHTITGYWALANCG